MTHRLPSAPLPASLTLALEPRIMFDAAAVATAADAATDTAAQADATPEASPDAPSVDTDTAEVPYTIDGTDTSGEVAPFANTDISLDASDQELTTLEISVGASGANQALVIDGTEITLTAGSGTTTAHHYAYTVSANADGGVTISISIESSEAYTPSDVESLIDGIRYKALDGTVPNGDVAVTLHALSDEGGETAHPDLTSTIHIDNANNFPPTLDSNKTLDEIQAITLDGLTDQAAWSEDGTYVYIADNTGGLVVYAVGDDGALAQIQRLSGTDGAPTLTDLAVTSDGGSLYALDGNGVRHFSIADDGTVAYEGRTALGTPATTLSTSGDGTQLYVGTQYDGVYVYQRDQTTGELGDSTRLSGDFDRNAATITAGDTLFVVAPNSEATSLAVFQRTGDGSLTAVTTLNLTHPWRFGDQFALEVSADGKTLYAANTSTGGIDVFSLDGDTLTHVTAVDLADVRDIALGGDGTTLYATGADGTVHVYDVGQNGTLSQTGTQAATGNAAVLTSGGATLVVGAGKAFVYNDQLSYDLNGDPVVIGPDLTLADNNLDILNDGAGNYNGASLTIASSITGGTFGLSEANGLTLSGNQVLRDGTVIATVATTADGLTITFTADVTSETANQVLRQITYANDDAPSGTKAVLSITVSDGEAASPPQTITVRLNTPPSVNEDVADAYVLDTATTETGFSVVLDEDLFQDADGDTLRWDVEGLPDGLTFDPLTRTISGTTTSVGAHTLTVTVTESSGNTATTEVTLQVDQIANRDPALSPDAPTVLDPATQDEAYTVTLPADLFSDADALYGDTLTWTVDDLPDGLTYDAATRTISGTASAVADYTVTITARDQDGASTSTTVTLRVITADEAANRAPDLGTDSPSTIYHADGTLDGFDGHVTDMTLSEDGTTLIVSSSSEASGAGATTLSVFLRDTATGELTLLQTFVDGETDDGDPSNGIEVPGLTGLSSVTVSADGQHVYVATQSASGEETTSSVLTFDRDNATGALTHDGSTATFDGEVVDVTLSGDGDHLYVLTRDTLHVYDLGSDGAPTPVSSVPLDTANAVDMTRSADGLVYILSSSTVTILGPDGADGLAKLGWLERSGADLHFTNRDGTTTTIATLDNPNALSGSASITAAADGRIYIATENGFVTAFQYDQGTNDLGLVEAHDAYNDLTDYPYTVTLSADGKTLFVSARDKAIMAHYAINADGSLSLLGTVETPGAGNVVTISGDGHSLYIGGNRWNSPEGLRMVSAQAHTASGQYTEQETIRIGEGIILSDADYDALDDGNGNYDGATLTLTRADGADASDLFGIVEADGLALDAETGVLTLNGTTIATVTHENGTLTITFTGDVSTATANAVLQSITYTSQSDVPPGQIDIAIDLRDEYTTTTLTRQLTVTALNDPPAVDTTPQSPTYADSTGEVALFDGTQVDTIEEGQTLLGLTLTIDGLTDGAYERLRIDGTTVSLVDGIQALTTNGFRVRVSVDAAGTATVTIDFGDGASPAQVAETIDGLAYGNTQGTTGTRVVTVSGLRDSGGGEDSAALSLTSTVTLSVDNTAPIVHGSGNPVTVGEGLDSIPGVSDVSATEIGPDGRTVYVAGNDGNIAVFSRDPGTGALTYVETIASGLDSVGSLSLSGDGTTLYAMQRNGSAGGNILAVFAIDGETGTLDSVQVVANGEGIGTPTGFAVSDDGTHAWVTGDWDVIVHYDRDPTTGALGQGTATWMWNFDGVDATKAVAAGGGYAFIASRYDWGTDTLVVIEPGTEGVPSFVASVPVDGVSAISVSADGRTVFALGSEGVSVLTFDPESGTLVAISVIEGTASGTGIQATADGTGLYVTNGDGTMSLYDVADGNATLVQTLSDVDAPGLSNPSSPKVADDGSVVVVNGDGLQGFLGPQAPKTFVIGMDGARFAEDLTLSDRQFDALGEAGNYNGATLTVEAAGGTFGVADGSGLTLVDGVLSLDGTAIATVTQTGDTLTVTFTADVSTATANQVLHGLTYDDASLDAGQTASLTLTVGDGGLSSDAVTLHVLAQANTPPEATNDPFALSPVEINVPLTVSLPDTLFSDAEGETLSWSVDGLPTGLSFDAATRTISGTPTALGAATLTVTVTDGAGGTATRTITLEVEPPNQAPEAGTDAYAPPTATVGGPYSATLPDSLFSDPDGDALTWTVPDLPEGWSFDAETRTLRGVPAEEGEMSFTVTVTDGDGAIATRTLSLTIEAAPVEQPLPPPPLMETPDLPSAEVSAPGIPPSSTGTDDRGASATPTDSGVGAGMYGSTERSTPPPGQHDPLSFLRPVGEQLSMTNAPTFGASSETGIAPDGEGGFALRDGTWVSTPDPSAMSGTVSLRLPEGVSGNAVQLRLTNGLPLPSWVRYDAASGNLDIDADQLARAGDIRIRIVTQTADGATQDAVLDIRAPSSDDRGSRPDAATTPPAVEEVPPTERQSGGLLDPSPRHGVPSSLVEDALALLASLAGLPPTDAAPTSGDADPSSRPSV